MLNKVSIKKRLTLGFIVLISLMLLISIIAFKSISTSSDGFIEYRSIARITNITGRIQANMLKLRTSVKNFQVNGDEIYKNEVEDASVVLNILIEEGIQEITNTDQKIEILEIEKGLNEYLRNFEKIVAFRIERDKSVYGVLDIQGPVMENTLSEVLNSFEKSRSKQTSFEATYAMKHLLLGRLYMAKFLDNNDQGAVSRVSIEFNKMQGYLDELLKDTQDNKRLKLLKAIQVSKNTYLETFDNLVEIINSRNDIQQNILDKIGPEIAVNIEKIKLSVKEHQDILGPQLQSANTIVIFLIALIAVLSLLISIFISTIVLKSIINPIKAITDSAKALSKGQVDIPINIDSKDEIGLLADSFNLIIKSLSDKANVARRIAEGDYTVPVNLLSNTDMLGKSMIIMRDSLEKREEELKNSKEQFSTMVSNVPGIIFRCLLDEHWTMLFISKEITNISGYPVEDFIQNKNKSYADLIHPDDVQKVQDAVAEKLASKEQYDVTYRILTANGAQRWVRSQGLATYDENDQPKWLDGAITDITKQKEAELQIKNSEENIQKIIETAPVGLAIVDMMSTKALLVNNAMGKLFYLNPDDVLSLNTKTFYANLSDREIVLKEIQEKGVLHNMELLLTRGENSETFWGVTSMTPIEYFGTKAAIVSVIDVTEMKKLQLGIEKAKDVAEAATIAKSQFLASMSHEIRTPMNAVIGLSHLALQTDLNPKQYDYLYKIQSSGKALLGIINDILDFSKIEAGKLEIEESEFDLEKVVNDVATIVTYKAHEKNIELIFNINENIPLSLKGDPLRIGQILINLCNNAIKFTAKGEILIKIDIEKQVEEDIWLKFSVKDSGIGIKKEHQSKLFDSFSQADSSTTRKYGGSGLGLAICKNLTEIMGGNIWLESEYEKGSTFSFTIKLKRLKDQKVTKLIPSIDLREMRVLLCDDNETVLTVLSNMLRSLTFIVTAVTSGKEALKELEKKTDTPYKLVLLDWKMPEMDGLEVAEKIKTSTSIADIPTIIMVTAYTRDEIIQRVDNLNLAGLLTKPVSHSTIFDTIMHAFGKETFINKQNEVKSILDEDSLKAVQGARILLVEDNEINQQVASELLESANLIIDIANNGLEAVEKANSSQDYDLVFMDLQMPVMDGITAATEIRKNKSLDHMPIVAMTADVLGGIKEKCLDVGMNDFIAKPINPSLVFEMVVKWIKPGERDISNIKTKSVEIEAGIIVIPKLDGIDIASGLNRVNNNKKLYQQLLLKFYDSNKSIVNDIKEAYNSKDEDLTLRIIHTIKGVAGNIGANALQLTSVELERKLINGEISDLNKVLEEYTPSLNLVLDSILKYKKTVEEKEAVIQENLPTDNAELDLEKFRASILVLISLIKDNDMDAISMLEEIYIIPGIAKLKEQLKPVEEALNNYDFDEALEICLKLKNDTE